MRSEREGERKINVKRERRSKRERGMSECTKRWEKNIGGREISEQ